MHLFECIAAHSLVYHSPWILSQLWEWLCEAESQCQKCPPGEEGCDVLRLLAQNADFLLDASLLNLEIAVGLCRFFYYD